MKRIPQCPKCKSRTLLLIEVWHNSVIYFEQDNGVILRSSENQDSDPFCVWAECSRCSHKWKLNGVIQISELPNYTIGMFS